MASNSEGSFRSFVCFSFSITFSRNIAVCSSILQLFDWIVSNVKPYSTCVPLQSVLAVCMRGRDPSQCVWALIVCVVWVVSSFCATSLNAQLCRSTPLRRTECTTFSVSKWRLQELVVGLFLFFCKEPRCELCEGTETVCNFFGEPVVMESECPFLNVPFERPI